MSSTSSPSNTQIPTGESDLTTDELFDVLASQRRRRVLGALYREDGQMERESLAESLAHDAEREQYEVEITLHHLVLPKLERTALVSDSDDGTVTLTSDGRSVAAWLEAVSCD